MQSDVLPQVVVHTLGPLLSGIQIPPGQLELSLHPLAIVLPPLPAAPPPPLEPLAPPREMVTEIVEVAVDVEVDVDGLPPVPRSPTLLPTVPALRQALAKMAEARISLENHPDNEVGR
jgi:hypothetical protein